MTDYKDRVSGWPADIDWSKAPEGFPIWIESLGSMAGSGWHRNDGDRWVDRAGSYWPKGADERGNCRVHLAPWSGDGLPPVGTECEIAASTEYLKISYPEGAKVKIYAHFKHDSGRELAAFVDQNCQVYGIGMAKIFAPIKTPAQIAAEEREAAVRELAGAIMGHAIGCRLPMSESGAERLADHLMMDGYTKTKGDDK